MRASVVGGPTDQGSHTNQGQDGQDPPVKLEAQAALSSVVHNTRGVVVVVEGIPGDGFNCRGRSSGLIHDDLTRANG
ncbi:hypothetical protein UVI_02042720 [Ustilaginoidea virens]|uniref:Uncharacterized protein n=1 Tax=Ustilaginoidea virens TaxID=1159556 RepID=A0A1B5L3G5_USTVR|nr:hypothetical protein UVI_02042720 [Ustilaginoidea virens]